MQFTPSNHNTQPKSQQHVNWLDLWNEKHNFQMFRTVFTPLSQSLLHSLSKLSLFICEHKSPYGTHTTHTHTQQPPGYRGNHNAAAPVQAELLRLIRLIVEFHRMGPSLPWN